MKKRDFADMIIFFCQKVSEMNISRKCRMELLGMITAIEIKHDELMQTTPCTTVDGAYTSGCTITNTSSPNEDFHPVRDCMVGKERTAKAIELDASVTDIDGYKYHRSEYLCGACKKNVIGGDEYCSHCGVRLEWE